MEGDKDGESLGIVLGSRLRESLGIVAVVLGSKRGESLGIVVEGTLGAGVDGASEGVDDGSRVSDGTVGYLVGICEGVHGESRAGNTVGYLIGICEGLVDGTILGMSLGIIDGAVVKQ
jgi:hypothetical protein